MKRLVTIVLSLILVIIATVPALAAPEDEVPTVNISEESIDAIAKAVSPPGSTLTLTNGVTITIPQPCLDVWGDYKYHWVSTSSGPTVIYMCNSELEVTSKTINGEIYYYVDVKAPIYRYNIRDNEDISTQFDDRYNVSGFKWTDFNIIAPDGSVLFESAFAPPPVYTISFNTGFDDITLDDQQSDQLHLPDLERRGFTFNGWYLDEDCTQEYFTEYKFDKHTTLYAKWVSIPKITYMTCIDDIEVEPQFLNELNPPQLSKPGIVFAGWFLDAEYKYVFTSDYEITEDITLYAKWLDAPDMFIFHDTIFDSLQALLNCEPVTYILVLMSIIIIIGIGKVLISTRI